MSFLRLCPTGKEETVKDCIREGENKEVDEAFKNLYSRLIIRIYLSQWPSQWRLIFFKKKKKQNQNVVGEFCLCLKLEVSLFYT